MYCLNKLRLKRIPDLSSRFYYDPMPNVTRKVFKPNPSRIKPEYPKLPPKPCTSKTSISGPRRSKIDIQMLSKAIYKQVFIEGFKDESDPLIINKCRKELEKHNMIIKEEECLPDVDFKLPPILGENIEEHFSIIGREQAEPYIILAQELIKDIPKPPDIWLLQEGWTRYAPGEEPRSVAFPKELALVFDIEVCMMVGKAPTLATAVSQNAWYAWISPLLINSQGKPPTSHQYSLHSLIPIESNPDDTGLDLTPHMKAPKIIVGHNVSFDRIRIKEQYWINKTGTRFIDTMSLHTSVSGLTSYQRAVIKSDKLDEEDESWTQFGSLNSLTEVYKLYCGKKLEKQTRDLFVNGTLSEIKDNFQEAMSYCSKDVIATHSVLQNLFPMFLERFPHPVTFAGMLEMSTAYLPINSNWNRFISDSEQTFEDIETEGKALLSKRADQAVQLFHDEMYKNDLWMWDQDWSVKNIKLRKTFEKKKGKEAKEETEEEIDELEQKFQKLWSTKDYLSAIRPLLPGYPEWYRKLCTKPNSKDWVPGPVLISTSMQVTPKLLSLTWEGFPLHFIRGYGWGFLVPFSDDLSLTQTLPLKELLAKCPLTVQKPKNQGEIDLDISKRVQEELGRKEYYSRLKENKTGGLYKGTGVWCNVELDGCCWFMKLPHKDGAGANVGNPLSKDFLIKFSENVLAGDTDSAEKVLSIARKLSYWRNNRDRINDQMVVWLEDQNLPKHLKGSQYGAILPQIVVCGTLTRRAMEPTWMTASNAHKERIGSELRSMIQTPKGFSFVGADVDSQELWIASVLGDAKHAKMHGATPLGWMTLSGTKANGTDMHSVTAKAVGISRDHAKVINYARIYGAGQNFAERLLKQFNPAMSDSEARSKAVKMFDLTKGKKIYFIKEQYLQEMADVPYTKWQAYEVAKKWNKRIGDMFHKSSWVGGTESAMFNCLEEIANSPSPVTPFLGCRLSRALEPATMSGEKYLPTRINWVVQSGAVDFLHLMLVCMKWIMKDKARFCLSFHDEVRYMVEDSYKYQAALALHVTNLLTRAFCSYKLGLHDLPQSVAFFSSVEVDTVLRKDAGDQCQTPSNPHGLSKGYQIPPGESLDIHQAILKNKAWTSKWYKIDRSAFISIS